MPSDFDRQHAASIRAALAKKLEETAKKMPTSPKGQRYTKHGGKKHRLTKDMSADSANWEAREKRFNKT